MFTHVFFAPYEKLELPTRENHSIYILDGKLFATFSILLVE